MKKEMVAEQSSKNLAKIVTFVYWDFWNNHYFFIVNIEINIPMRTTTIFHNASYTATNNNFTTNNITKLTYKHTQGHNEKNVGMLTETNKIFEVINTTQSTLILLFNILLFAFIIWRPVLRSKTPNQLFMHLQVFRCIIFSCLCFYNTQFGYQINSPYIWFSALILRGSMVKKFPVDMLK